MTAFTLYNGQVLPDILYAITKKQEVIPLRVVSVLSTIATAHYKGYSIVHTAVVNPAYDSDHKENGWFRMVTYDISNLAEDVFTTEAEARTTAVREIKDQIALKKQELSFLEGLLNAYEV